MQHAINLAKIFSQCKPMLVGTGGLTLFEGTPLLEEAKRGEFEPLTEKELMIELSFIIIKKMKFMKRPQKLIYLVSK